MDGWSGVFGFGFEKSTYRVIFLKGVQGGKKTKAKNVLWHKNGA
jgi:hypothetical protein